MTMTSALFVLLAFASLVFAALLLWVRKNKDKKTEKNFNLAALWSCVSVLSLYILHMLDSGITSNLLLLLNVEVPTPSLATQILVTLVLMFYLWLVYHWATRWDGLRTRHSITADRDGSAIFFAVDGVQETFRILRRLPSHDIFVQSKYAHAELSLPEPIAHEEFHQQVRDLILGRWSEYVVSEDAWVDAAQCWYGTDSSLDTPLLVFCALNPTTVDSENLRAQIAHHSMKKPAKVIAVFEQDITDDQVDALFGQYRLSATIYSFDSLIDAVLPLARYKAYIAREFTQRPLPNSELSISRIIVDTMVRQLTPITSGGFSTSTKAEKLSDFILEWLARSSDQHLAILGDYGQGKSTAALELAYKLLHDPEMQQASEKRIPILIRLTGMSPKTTTPEDLLGAWGTSLGFSGQALLALHRAGRTLLIFDAFDEMANVSDRGDRLDHFGALWRFACEGAKLLFTGRPNFFLDNEELKLVLGISELSSSGPYCTAVRIEPFSMAQVTESLRWLSPSRASQLLATISEQERLREIAARPSLLFQLTQLWNGDRLNLEAGSLHSGTIIREFVTYSIERQVRKQYNDISSSTGEKSFIRLRESELTYFTAGCAIESLSEDRNNSLSEADFHKTISTLWDNVGEVEQFERNPSEEGSLTMPLRERLADEEDPISVCEQMVRTHGVIELDPTRRAVYRFSHKSLAEASSATVIASGAVGDHDEWAKTWKALRPIKLLRQFTVFQFCHDCARSYALNGIRLAEHRVYCNVTVSPDNLASRALYYYRRLFLSAQMTGFERRVADMEELERRDRKERSGTWKRLRAQLQMFMSARAVIQLAPMLSGIMVGVFVATGIGDDADKEKAWQTILISSSVPISLLAYFGLVAAVNRQMRLVILFCNMFAHPEISLFDDKRRSEGLRGVLRAVLNNPRAFSSYSRQL